MGIDQLDDGLTVGRARLGRSGTGTGSPAQRVHDGDTVSLELTGNVGSRLLGVDAAEVSFQLPGERAFRKISAPQWQAFLADPFAPAYPPFSPRLPRSLREHLRRRLNAESAANHARHAEVGRRALIGLVTADIAALGQDKDTFEFFLAFATEVIDRYGRLLCYLNRRQPDPRQPARRPDSYNERLLDAGVVAPYFIWPNVNPFRQQPTLLDAVPPPGQAREWAERDPSLARERSAVAAARGARVGIFDRADPLRLMPFELRYLARRTPPDRLVINLASDSARLLAPHDYFTVRRPEDRLFVPAEYAPLFASRGWEVPPGTTAAPRPGTRPGPVARGDW